MNYEAAYKALRAQYQVLHDEMRKLAREPGCGCTPPCRCKENAYIELEARIECAYEALGTAAMLCAHDWQRSSSPDPMLPGKWRYQCSICKVFEDET